MSAPSGRNYTYVDTNARILEIGIELGRIWLHVQERERLFGSGDWYGALQDMCLLFMEYEELARPVQAYTWTRVDGEMLIESKALGADKVEWVALPGSEAVAKVKSLSERGITVNGA